MSAPPADATSTFITAGRALVGIAVRSLAASPVELTVPQHRLLVVLAAAGDLPVSEVAERLGVNQSNATRMCDRLERLTLLRRRRDERDARVVRVGLTDEGAHVLQAVDEARHREVGRVLRAMDARERDAAVAALRAFNLAAHELGEEHWHRHVW
jgi:DNA-binding MarR family transcriptional regulator